MQSPKVDTAVLEQQSEPQEKQDPILVSYIWFDLVFYCTSQFSNIFNIFARFLLVRGGARLLAGSGLKPKPIFDDLTTEIIKPIIIDRYEVG